MIVNSSAKSVDLSSSKARFHRNKCLKKQKSRKTKLTSWGALVPRWPGRRWPCESAFPWSRHPDRHCRDGHPRRCWGMRTRGLQHKGPKAPSASGKLYRHVRYSSVPPGGHCCLDTGRHLTTPKQVEDQNVWVWEENKSWIVSKKISTALIPKWGKLVIRLETYDSREVSVYSHLLFRLVSETHLSLWGVMKYTDTHTQ